MAQPGPGQTIRDPLYGKYPGSARLHLDQVPLGFGRLFRTTLAKKGLWLNFARRTKNPKRDIATLVYVCRAEGKQPPPILVLQGGPSREDQEKIKSLGHVSHIP